jgi:hypothetical protein
MHSWLCVCGSGAAAARLAVCLRMVVGSCQLNGQLAGVRQYCGKKLKPSHCVGTVRTLYAALLQNRAGLLCTFV